MRRVALVASLIAVLATPAAADDNKARADKLFEDGRRYLAAKEYALACTAFEESHAADPAIGTQLNIALCYEEWGKVASAYRAYVEAERLAKLKFDERSRGARKKVDELAAKVPKLRLELPPGTGPSLVILFDKKELPLERLDDELLVDPGTHSIEARVPGKPPRESTVDIAVGERKTITIDVPEVELPPAVVVAAPRRTGRLYGGIGLVTGGAVAVGVASFVALGARQDYNDAVAMCPQFVCTTRTAFDATQDARSRANLMTWVGAGGVLLAGAGVYLILTSRGAPIVPVVARDQVGFAIGGSL